MKNVLRIIIVVAGLLLTLKTVKAQYMTGVYVNSHELNYQTLSTLQSLIGSIPAGKYYMDQEGNFGIVDYPPVVNLYKVAEQRYGYQYNSSRSSTPSNRNNKFTYRKSPNSAGIHMKEGNKHHYSNWKSGAIISSDGENSVISIDGKVLNLPPY